MRNVMSGQSSNDDILIFIMRHGEAEAPRLDDKSRQLTSFGRQQAVESSQWLCSHYCQTKTVNLALVSPYRRTKQTLDLVSLDIVADKVEVSEDIVPEGAAQEVCDYLLARIHTSLKTKQPIKRLLVVSHMPLVSYLVDALCASYTASLFATGSIAVVRYSLSTHKA